MGNDHQSFCVLEDRKLLLPFQSTKLQDHNLQRAFWQQTFQILRTLNFVNVNYFQMENHLDLIKFDF